MNRRLEFEVDVQQQLLDYAETSLIFSDARVNTNIVTWNKYIIRMLIYFTFIHIQLFVHAFINAWC